MPSDPKKKTQQNKSKDVFAQRRWADSSPLPFLQVQLHQVILGGPSQGTLLVHPIPSCVLGLCPAGPNPCNREQGLQLRARDVPWHPAELGRGVRQHLG